MASINHNAPLNFWDMSQNQHISDLQGVQGLRPQFDLSGTNTPAYKTGAEGQAAQAAALQMYGQMARGQSGSVAEDQLRQMGRQNISAGYGMAGMQRGGNLYGARQAAPNAAMAINAGTDQQAAILRAQQMQAARAGMADLATSVYGQGFGYDQLTRQSALQGNQNAVNWYAANRELDQRQKASDREFYGKLINGGIALGGSLIGMAGAA